MHRVVAFVCGVGLVGLAAAVSPAKAADRTVRGTIQSFECGDNCYLTIRTGDGEDLTGLCAAPECAAWNEAVAMPPEFEGRAVTARVGTGTQYDNEGNAMGETASFEALAIGR